MIWKILLLKEYNTTRNKIKKECKKGRSSFEINLARDKKNSKRLFAYVNSKQKINTGMEALIREGKVTYDKKEIADTLNNHFDPHSAI